MARRMPGWMLALILIAAVGGTAAGQGVVTLVFRQNDTPLEAAGLLAAISVWNHEHPSVQVRFETVPWSDARDQFIRESQVGGAPDVAQLAFTWTPDFTKAGMLMDLSGFLKQDPPPHGLDDFLALDFARSGNAVNALPWTADTFAMVYRTDILEKAGIKRFPDTWDDLQKAAVALSKERGRFGFAWGAGAAPGGAMLFPATYYLWSNGYDWLKKDAASGAWDAGVDQKALGDAIRYFKGFFEQGASPQSLIAFNSWADPTIVRGMQSGTFAITPWPPATLQAVLKADPNLPLASALIPRGSVRRISHLGGRMLAISARTKHPREAWELMKYLTSERVFRLYYTEQMPAQKTLLRQVKLAPQFKGYAEMMPIARTFYEDTISPAPWPAVWDTVNREFNAAFSGQKDPDTAARDLIATIRQLLKRQ